MMPWFASIHSPGFQHVRWHWPICTSLKAWLDWIGITIKMAGLDMGCHNTAKPEIVMGLVLIEARNLPLTSSNVLCSTFIPPSRLRLVVPPSCLRRMVKGASCSRLLRGSFKNSHLLIGWCTRYPSNTIIGMTGLALNGRYIFFNWLKPWIDTSDFDLEFEICNNRGGLISWKPRANTEQHMFHSDPSSGPLERGTVWFPETLDRLFPTKPGMI